MNPDVDPSCTERYTPSLEVSREVDLPQAPSAFPPERRFDTIYPFSRASEDATDAALRSARMHDRDSTRKLLAVIEGRATSED